MKTRITLFCALLLTGTAGNLFADIVPSQVAAPFGVQPGAGLMVAGGQTQGFFSDLSGLPFPGPGIVDVLSNLQAFDEDGNQILDFQVLDAVITQGSNQFTVPVEPFDVSFPVTYSSYLNPLNQATVDPSNLNLAFTFNSDPSLQYTYQLDVSGIPDNGFVLYDDIEGAQASQTSQAPEPSSAVLLLTGAALIGGARRRRGERRSVVLFPSVLIAAIPKNRRAGR